MKKLTLLSSISLLVLITVTSVYTAYYPFPPVVIDHTNWDPSDVDISILDKIRTKKIIHMARSLGSDMAGGIMNISDNGPGKYYIRFSHAPVSPNYMDQPGFGYEMITNVATYESVPWPACPAYDDLNAFKWKIRSNDDHGMEWGNVVDIVEFNVGWSTLRYYDSCIPYFKDYIAAIDSLRNEYPNCTFVYYTCNLKVPNQPNDLIKQNQIAQQHFTEDLRAYVDSAGGYLFDMADLECHDEEGNKYIDSLGNEKFEVLWEVVGNWENDGWARDDRGEDSTAEGHLNESGRKYCALARWKLWSSIVANEVNINGLYPVGNKQSKQSPIKVYLNPFNFKFRIPNSEFGKRIRIYDLAGNLIKEVSLNHGNNIFQVNGINNGLYLLELEESKILQKR